jgi:hypothetical protein
MDNSSITSVVLFDALQRDLGIVTIDGDRFNPFPFGFPTDLSPGEYAKHALLHSVFRKTEVESDPEAEMRTLVSFLEANEACKVPRDFLHWDGRPDVGYAIASARQFLYAAFEPSAIDWPVSMATIEQAARFGPGSSIGLDGKPSSYYFKVGDSPQAATSPFIIDWYARSTAWHPLCEAAELARKARCGEAVVVKHGNLTFVPKSYTSRRIVVTEPSLNTYFQLGLGSVMERVLKYRFGIDFSVQPGLNSEMARVGSLDGSYGTMDLKQCSDYISCQLVEFMFPKSLVNWLNKLRTPTVRPPKGADIDLGMISTMGNGFTFPLQTLLLTALVLGVYETLGIEPGPHHSKKWGVFGDDIVVAREAYDLLSEVLKELGLIVGHDKSFNSGSFRESCGADYFDGVNVRGVYLKRYLSDQDLYSAFNRLSVWSAYHGILLRETLSTIVAIIRDPVWVPPDESENGGFITPFPLIPSEPDGSWEYSVYIPNPSSFDFEPWERWETCLADDPKTATKKLKRWLGALNSYCDGSVNEPALFKAALVGGLRRNRLIMRQRNVRYRKVVRTTPRWGFSPRDGFPEIGSHCYERLGYIIQEVLACA